MSLQRVLVEGLFTERGLKNRISNEDPLGLLLYRGLESRILLQKVYLLHVIFYMFKLVWFLVFK